MAINGAVSIQHMQTCHSLLQSWACLEMANCLKKAESCIQICSPAAKGISRVSDLGSQILKAVGQP
eukprot:3981143-Ditylum_brightwellii.AAC.1